MEYLHKCNVVHFDLKAENLLCDLRNLDSPVVKIGDMGTNPDHNPTQPGSPIQLNVTPTLRLGLG